MIKYIKNLEDQTQSVLAEDVAKDAAEISGLDPDAVSDAVAGLNFASYLELGNAIANEDGELVRELLNISDVVPDEPIADDEIDLEEDNGYKHTETLICERCRGDGADAWGETCDKCGGKGRLSLDGEYLDEEKLLDKPTPSLKDLAKKHDRSLADMGSQLAKGIKAEKEHTTDMLVAKEIALDHLNELPDYYDRLETIEEGEFSYGKNDPLRDQPIPGKKLAKPMKSWGEILHKLNDKKLIALYKDRHPDWEYMQPSSMQSGWPIKREIDRRGLIVEADNPYAPPTAAPVQQAATPPSAGSSIDALAEPVDTATDTDDEEVQQARKEVDDLQIGDQIEVADIDGQPAAGRVRNLAGPGDTLVITGKGNEEHMIRKDSILSTPMIPVVEKKQSRLDKTHLGQKNKRADRVEKKKTKDVQEAGDVRGTYRVSYNNDEYAPDFVGYWEDSEYTANSPADAKRQAEKNISKQEREFVWPVRAKLVKKFRAIGGPNKDQEVLVDNYEVDTDAMREAYENALEGKWDYKQKDKGKGAGGPMQDGGAKNRKNRKAFRKAERAKAHAARMRGEVDESDEGELNDRYDPETLECKHCGDYFCTSKFGGDCPGIQKDMFDEGSIGDSEYSDMYSTEETYDEMVEYWKQSLSQSIVRKGVFTQIYDAAGQDIEVLNREIEDQARSIADSYHGSGEGIGSSDQNHFIYNIATSLGIKDIFGWDKKPKGVLKSKEEMDRDMTNRVSKYRKATQAEGISEAKNMVVKYQGRKIGTVWQEEDGEWHGEHSGSGMSWATDNRKDMFSRIKDHEIESLNEGTGFHFFVDPQEVGANVMNSKGEVHDYYDSEEEALAVAKDLNAQYGQVDEARGDNLRMPASVRKAMKDNDWKPCEYCKNWEDGFDPRPKTYGNMCPKCDGAPPPTMWMRGDEDISRIRELAGIKETASSGGTGAGAIASSPVAVGGVRKRNPSIYGQTKLKKKPTPKKRETKEDTSAGIGRSKKA